MIASSTTPDLAISSQGLDSLRRDAQTDPKKALKGVAQQFEAYFLQMMMKSMRANVSEDGLMDSQESKTFTDMFDQQLSQNISSSKGLGLTEVLMAQLESKVANIKPTTDAADSKAKGLLLTAPKADIKSSDVQSSVVQPDDNGLTRENFVNNLWPHAVEAAKALGVAPHVLLAQAALETGWGQHVAKNADGSSSHNLFNIKASANWKGNAVNADTLEYDNGVASQQKASFRAYGSFSEAFADYAHLLTSNPRYNNVTKLGADAQSFVKGLQTSGYATDPQYADKVMRVLNSSVFRAKLAG